MHINIYIEPFKVKVRFCLSVHFIIAQNFLAQPLNSTACIVHWEPVDDNRENLRGKLGGYRVSQFIYHICTGGGMRTVSQGCCASYNLRNYHFAPNNDTVM